MVKELTPALLEHLALLARLDLSLPERKGFLKELNKILEAFSDIKQTSRPKHPASSRSLRLSQLKPQKVLTCALAEELLERAPERKGRLFRVPKVGRLE